MILRKKCHFSNIPWGSLRLCSDTLKRTEWNGVERSGTEWSRVFIWLFGYFIAEWNKLSLYSIVWKTDGMKYIIIFYFIFYPYLIFFLRNPNLKILSYIELCITYNKNSSKKCLILFFKFVHNVISTISITCWVFYLEIKFIDHEREVCIFRKYVNGIITCYRM